MSITVNSLTPEQYDTLTSTMLKDFEGSSSPDAYVDSNGHPTIGIGFLIDSANIIPILDGMGYGHLELTNPNLFSKLRDAIVEAETHSDICFAPGTAGAQEALNKAVNSVLGTGYNTATGNNFGYGNNTSGSSLSAADQMEATFVAISKEKKGTYLFFGERWGEQYRTNVTRGDSHAKEGADCGPEYTASHRAARP